MEVRVGWATEFGKEKFDVSMNEDDIVRVLTEAGLPARLALKITTREAFQLLTLEARRFADFESLRHITDPTERANVTAQVKAATEGRKALVDQLSARLHTVEPA